MSDSERIDQEPEAKKPEKVGEAPKARRAFSKVRRELSEEELSSPAVHRLLLDELDQLEQQVVELSGFRDRFYKVDKDKAVLEEKLRISVSSEVMFGVCLTVGATFIGLAPYFWDTKPQGHLSLGIGIILIIGGIVSRVVRK